MFDCWEERVLDKIVLPELHLMMGVVNHLFNSEILEWIKKNDILMHGYQGEVWKEERAPSYFVR